MTLKKHVNRYKIRRVLRSAGLGIVILSSFFELMEPEKLCEEMP